jgi:hypothetical protein
VLYRRPGGADIISREAPSMTETHYQKFIHDHLGEIVERVVEMDNFSEADISVLKGQIVTGIKLRKKMPVAPLGEIKCLIVGYIAIKFIEDELGFTF